PRRPPLPAVEPAGTGDAAPEGVPQTRARPHRSRPRARKRSRSPGSLGRGALSAGYLVPFLELVLDPILLLLEAPLAVVPHGDLLRRSRQCGDGRSRLRLELRE